MQIEREAALCLIRRGAAFLVSELTDPDTGALLHRPPGGGVEPGETPEMAVRRELMEELGIALGEVEALGFIDHVWKCDGRITRERAWIFTCESSVDARLDRGEAPELLEANGERIRTLWRRMEDEGPPLCPESLARLATV